MLVHQGLIIGRQILVDFGDTFVVQFEEALSRLCPGLMIRAEGVKFRGLLCPPAHPFAKASVNWFSNLSLCICSRVRIRLVPMFVLARISSRDNLNVLILDACPRARASYCTFISAQSCSSFACRSSIPTIWFFSICSACFARSVLLARWSWNHCFCFFTSSRSSRIFCIDMLGEGLHCAFMCRHLLL